MCGRFVSSSTPDEIASYFDVEQVAETLQPNYNVAPTNDVYAVLEDGGVRHLDAFHWGLVPSWAKDPGIGSRMINARAETLAEKNAFKKPFAARRCIIPADGFYEWKTEPGVKKKQPYLISRPDGRPFAIAGLWSVWRGGEKDGEWQDESPLRSCTIITTTPNEPMSEIHDRMPVILAEKDWAEWLDRDNDDIATLGKLLVPAPEGIIAMHPVDPKVGNVRNKGSELVDIYDPDEGKLAL